MMNSLEILQHILKGSVNTTEDIAKEIWIDSHTLKKFLDWKYSEKTFQLVKNRFDTKIHEFSSEVMDYKNSLE